MTSRSRRTLELHERARRRIPGGGHTYSKGDDQFPSNAPLLIERGRGSRVWDTDGNEWLDFGMGLRSVLLGHAYPAVLDAVRAQLERGSNFTRPAPIEGELAELLAEIIPGAEMSKFAKNGSDVTTAATRLARAYTGRPIVAACRANPFYSFDDWWIGKTETNAGIPQDVSNLTLLFDYNDITSLERLFAEHPRQIACVILEPVALEPPKDDFLRKVVELSHREGAVVCFDEMISGFRYHLGGAQTMYGVRPDLATFGKAIANGFSTSVLCGRADIMRLGGLEHDQERVFLLSATHGAETHALAAAIATINEVRHRDVPSHVARLGARLKAGINFASESAGLSGIVECIGYDASPVIVCRDRTRMVSWPLRTLFLQEMCARGILIPYVAISYSHQDEDIDHTIAAAAEAMQVYARAIDEGVERFLNGPAAKPVFRRYN
jgi:glutamate-1-semialdehyde 2,1-aminomutase